MKRIFLSLLLLLSTTVYADNVTFHAWIGKAYTDSVGVAVWNKTVNAYVISQETMDLLQEQHPGCSVYANSNSFLGSFAGLIKWHYPVVTLGQAEVAQEQGHLFVNLNVEAAQNVGIDQVGIAVPRIVRPQIDGPKYGPNGEPVFHANETNGSGYYYRRQSDKVLMNALTNTPAE